MTRRESILSVVGMAIAAFFFTLQSPLHPWHLAGTLTDSSVFKTVSMMMGRGYLPYRDTFDHKGPLLYVINRLGDLFSGYRGVWILEMVFLTVTFVMIYVIARMFCKRGVSWIVSFAAISLLFMYYQGGNLAEEYAMPFIAISLWVFLEYFLKGRSSIPRLMICGGCLMAVLMLRPNMIALWIVMCVGVLVRMIRRRDGRRLGWFVLWFVAGMAVVLIPFLVWMGANHILGNFWTDYIAFNMQYTSQGTWLESFADRWEAFFTFQNCAVLIIAVGVCVVGVAVPEVFAGISCVGEAKGNAEAKGAGAKGTGAKGARAKDVGAKGAGAKRAVTEDAVGKAGSERGERLEHVAGVSRGFFILYLAYLIVTLIFMCMSGQVFMHYGMIMVPAVALPLALVFRVIGELELRAARVVTLLVSLCVLCVFVLSDWLPLIGQAVERYRTRSYDYTDATVLAIRDQILENTREDDFISVYGNWDILYVLSGRSHATRYSYQDPIGQVKPEILDEYFKGLEDELPPIIVVQWNAMDDRMQQFLDTHAYALPESGIYPEEAWVYMHRS